MIPRRLDLDKVHLLLNDLILQLSLVSFSIPIRHTPNAVHLHSPKTSTVTTVTLKHSTEIEQKWKKKLSQRDSLLRGKKEEKKEAKVSN